MVPEELLPTRLISPSEREPATGARLDTGRFHGLKVARRLFLIFWHNLLYRSGDSHAGAAHIQAVKAHIQPLGMLWIKLIQTFALRTGAFPPALIKEIMEIRDVGSPGPFGPMRAVLEEALGRPMTDVFEEFEEVPFASTTVSQIHRARLKREGVWVAVKIQQPNAYKTFMRDLALIRNVIRGLNWVGMFPNMRWGDLYYEMEEGVTRELNYQYELSALKMLAKNLINQPMHAPEVFGAYSGPRVLVMEFIRAALMSDFIALSKSDPNRLQAWLKTNNIDPKLVAERLFHVVYRQIFEDNFFHGDMKTHNIILLRDSRLAIIDCRTTGSMEQESLKKQAMFLSALGDGEFITAGEIYFLLASRLPKIDLNKVKQELVRIWRSWELRTHVSGLSYDEKSMTTMMHRVTQLTFRHRFGVQWAFSRLNGAWVHLDQSLEYLNPDLNYRSELVHYFRQSERRCNIRMLVETPVRLAAALSSLHKLPKRMDEYTLFQETVMRRQAQVAQGSTSKIEAMIGAFLSFCAFVVVLLFVVFTTALFITAGGNELKPILGAQLAGVFARLPLADWGFSLTMLLILGGGVLGLSSLARKFSGQHYSATSSSQFLDA